MGGSGGGCCGGAKPYTVASVVAASLVALFIGYDIGIMSEAKRLMRKDLEFDIEQMEWIVASMNIAAGTGMLVGGPVADMIGRRATVGIGCLAGILGSVGTGFASTFRFMLMARFVLGLGVGVSSVSASMWVAELSPREHRGRFGSLFELQINVGIIVGYAVGWGLSEWSLSIGWRIMLFAQTVAPTIVFLSLFALPESPRWLMMTGKKERGLAVMERIFSPEEVAELQQELTQLDSVEVMQRKGTGQTGCCGTPALRAAWVIALGVAAANAGTVVLPRPAPTLVGISIWMERWYQQINGAWIG